MGRPNRQRQGERTADSQLTESAFEGDAEPGDLTDVDPEEVITTDDGELIHEPTGIVLDDEQIDHGPEWRSFSQTERDEKSRVGAPRTEMLHDRGLTTDIGWRNRDAYGQSVSSKKQQQLSRLRT